MNNNIEFYTFDYSKYISLLKENEEMNPKLLVVNIIKSYNVSRFKRFIMIRSLLRDKVNYPILENHFEYAAEFLLLKNLKDRGENMKSLPIENLKDRMSKLWDKL